MTTLFNSSGHNYLILPLEHPGELQLLAVQRLYPRVTESACVQFGLEHQYFS